MNPSGHGRSPYVGLRAFRENDHERFFGRLKESHEIAALWRASKLTILYGGSGVGKTSLLHAGVIPLLDPDNVDVLPIGRVSAGAFPPDVKVPNPYIFSLLSSLGPDRPSSELADLTISQFLRQRGLRRDPYGDPLPILLAIDQAEELFAEEAYRPHSVKGFIARLARALHSVRETRLLLTVREDRLPAALAYERMLAGHSRSRYRLLPFEPSAAMAAIKRPLAGTGRRFATGVARDLVGELRAIRATNQRGQMTSLLADTVDPVQVQVVCSELWESLPDGVNVITSAHLRRFGDVDRFLAAFCSRTLSTVARQNQVRVARLRSWLQQTFVTEFGTRGMAYEGVDQTAGMPNAVVRSLEDHHLLKAEHRSGIRWYELQHDRLIEPLRQAHPVELLDAAELELADGALALAERSAGQAIASCGLDDLGVRGRAERVLGCVAERLGRHEEALRRYRLSASLYETVQDSAAVARALMHAARLSLVSGHFAEAVSDLRAATERAPGDLSIKCELANAVWQHGQPLAAVSVLGGLLERDPGMMSALRLRGEILADLNKAEEALADLYRVRTGQGPGTVAARALAHASVGRMEAADQEAADAAANAAGSGIVLFRVARVRQLTGEAGLALRYVALARASDKDPLPSHLRAQAERMHAALLTSRSVA